MSVRHEPVLLAEVLGFLRNGPGLYLDATLGDAGHAEALLEAEPGARLLGCDRDPSALEHAAGRLTKFGTRVRLAHATFREVPAALTAAGGGGLVGALFDLGLSSTADRRPGEGDELHAGRAARSKDGSVARQDGRGAAGGGGGGGAGRRAARAR